MKELDAGSLPESSRVGTWGVGACAYGCPGCPAGVREDGLRIRIVGWNGDLVAGLERGPRRDWELATGCLPPDAAWPELARHGVRRALTPIFGALLAGRPELPDEILAAHDAACGIPGAGASALASLEVARASGIAPVLLGARDRAGGAPSPDAVRALTRLAWSRRLGIEVVPGDASPPCIP